MGALRRFVSCVVVSALCVMGMPLVAMAAPQSFPAAKAATTAGSGGSSKRPAPKNTTFAWSPPKSQPAPQVRVDPNAKRVAELPERRNANASVYRLSDGREQQVLSASPVHYQDAKGAWQPIDTAVVAVHRDGFSVGNETNAYRSYFSSSADQLVRVEQGSSFVQMGADGAQVGAPTVSKDTVTYADVFPGASLSYRVGAGALKEQIVLSKAQAAGTAYSFTLKVGGFVPRQRADGSIAFYGAESNQAALVIPAPYMSDAKADASSPYGTAYSTKVSQSMKWDAKSGTLRLTVRPDASWLADTHRVYPVVIDPTILVAPTPSQAANVMIGSDVATSNFSTSWKLSAGTSTSGDYRALIKFPMPSVPAGATISSANLNLYYDQAFTTGSNNVPLEAHQATAAWDPTTATWNSASGISGALAGSTTKQANVVGVWNSYPVTSTVQAWLNGTTPNYGFVVQAQNESTMGQGGPRYEASIYAYQGETINYPQLVITYGVPGVTLNAPSVIHSTGAELSWSAYQNNTADPNNNIVEYQVHRSVYQTFTPNASTEVAPVDTGSTSFVDSTAQPTPTSSSDPYGNAYYYMVVVKTANGALISAPTQLVRLPKAGLTTVLLRGGAATTLSSGQPTAVLNTLPDTGVAQQWLEVGDNSATYGNARAVFDFGALPASIPANATISEAHLKLWQETTFTGTTGAVYELHALTRGFTMAQATWNNANSTTAWTTPGGDFNPTAAGTVSNLTNDPNRQTFDATSIVQGWVNTPSSNNGLEVKVANESGAQERTLFAGPNTAEPMLAPALVLTYLDPTSGTYYAPSTPEKMAPGTTYTVPVTINNTSGSTWAASNQQLTYHWTLPDGTDVTNTSNQLSTTLPADMAPGAAATLNAQVTPPTPADTNSKGQYTLAWDMKNTTTGTYLSGSNGIGSLKQATGVEEPGSNQLGLEKFYQYTAQPTGAGGTLYTNVSSGNTVWNYNAFSNPSRGFATFVRMSYNSLDTTDSTLGNGWTLQASTPTRLGTALDFHPNPNPTEVTFTDGTGTSHVFTWNSTSSTWTSPPGIHLYLQQLASCGPQVTNARAWQMTRPDRTQFFYDCEGYPTAVVDKDGNEADFTYSARQSQNKPEEFLAYITDPTGRKTLTVNYYAKGDNYSYIDSTGTLVAATKLTNPAIIDHVKSVVDISGREIDFYYTTQGLMARMVDGAGNSAAKTFNFTYDATQGNKNVKLVQVADPRGNATKISYYDPVTDPKFHWWTQNVTDRLSHTTAAFAYTEPGAITNSAIQTTVTDANNHATTYQVDSTGRLMQAVNPLNQKTALAWDGDNNVTSLTENNTATTTWTYDPNTGYPLSMKDALANKNNTAASTYTYQTSLNGHIADITDKVSPAGRHWRFAYDANGNLTSVQDPNGTAAASGYTTTYTYDTVGDLLTATDANNHATTYSSYDPTGYPNTTKDPVGNTSSVVYGPRGEVTSATDALGHTTTQNYDVFGRPLDGKTPKDQANNVYITTPAPVYDANDNITQKTAPNGAVSTATYNANDEATASTLPPDSSTSPTRTTSYTYDAVGNQLTVTAPDGNVSGAAAGSYTTTAAYDVLDRVVSSTDAVGNKTTTSYDDVGNTTMVVDPLKANTTGYTSSYAYDLDHRPTTVTDATGHTKSTAYDLDSLKTSTTDEDGQSTLYAYDQDRRTTQVQVPHTSSGTTITYNTTQYQYDQVGNETAIISPRGVASGIANAYTVKTSYDADNRKIASFGAYNPNDSTYNTAPETDYSYDANSRLTQVSAPPSQGQTVRNNTTYTYWDNGWTKSSTDPWAISTSYDYNVLGKQTARTITSAGGSSARTQGWGYYPDGKIQTRTDNGVPVGLQVEMVDNSDAQNVTATGTWPSSSSGTGYAGYDYQTHAAGAGTDSFTWNLSVPQDGTYQVYVQYPQVTGAATNASYTVNYNGGATTQTVDQTKNTGTWVSLGSYSFTQAGTGQGISLAQNSGGVVAADAVKIVRNNSADTQPGPQSFTYSYDVSGNLTDLADNSPGARVDDYAASYDGVSRLASLQEKKSGAVVHTTSFTYDADGNTVSRTHDQAVDSFTYDVRNLLTQVTNKETSSDPSPKVSSFTWTSSGQVATETKPNGNIATSSYFLDGALQHKLETKSDKTTTVAEHTYTYDPNGNQTQDAAKTENADNHTAYLNRTSTYAYTPRDQVASVTKSDGSAAESYAYDANANVVSQTVGGSTTTSNYDRNRLQSTVVAGVSSSYNYDPFGRLDTVSTAGSVVARYSYDGFDRIASEQKKSGTTFTTTNFAYDPFDRRVSQTENAGTSTAKTTVFDYLAMSAAVVDEQVNGTVTKSYNYSPWGERLAQIIHNAGGTEEPTYYSYNSHSDVQAVTDANGDTKSTYGYTAYGADDSTQATGADKPGSTTSTSGPYNAYRFNANRVDSSTGTYNMGFRTYDPGLNRFLTRDLYNGALSDMGLASDPYTGNRYTFGGGNPLSAIELDGHGWLSDLGHAALDAAGMIPVVGAVADVANGAWYAAEGDYLDAGISLAGAIPVIGDAALGARLAIKGAKYTEEGIQGLEALKNADHAVEDIAAAGKADAKAADAAAGGGGGGGSAAAAGAGDASTGAAQAEKAAQAERVAVQREAQTEAVAQQAEVTGEQTAERATAGETCNSFTPDTQVVMGDGTTKAIKDVKVGDFVESGDTTTGTTTAHAVTDLISTQGTKQLVDISVTAETSNAPTASEGQHSAPVSAATDGHVVATDHHPFWVADQHRWLDATQLLPGMWLRTSSGTYVQVTAVHAFTHTNQTVNNLTIETTHTYYVLAGTTPLLVHNSSACLGGNLRANGESPTTPDPEAHHIVPENHKRAQGARDVLDQHGIKIDSPENGVWLGHDTHRGTFTNDYVDWINGEVLRADALGGKSAVLDVLASTKRTLKALDQNFGNGL